MKSLFTNKSFLSKTLTKNLKLLYFLLFILLISSASLQSCKKSGSGLLSPARTIVGIWKTPSAVSFYYYTGGCGGYQRVAKVQMSMTWTITKKSDNEVDIEWRSDQTSSVQSMISPTCNLYIPIVTPKFLTGTISSSQMDIYEDNRKVGTLSLTTNNMAGYYYYGNECTIYCTGIGTNAAIPRAADDKTLILQKQ